MIVRQAHLAVVLALTLGASTAYAGSPTLRSAVGEHARIEWDSTTRSPARLWGSGVAVPPVDQVSHAAAVLARLLPALAPGARIGDFALVSDRASVRNGTTRRVVGFEQRAGGLPVVGASISFRYVADRLVMIADDAAPHARADLDSTLGEDAAIESAFQALADRGLELRDPTVTGPVVLPSQSGADEPSYRTVLRVEGRTEPLGHWLVYVDVATGEPALVEPLHHLATGSIQATVPER